VGLGHVVRSVALAVSLQRVATVTVATPDEATGTFAMTAGLSWQKWTGQVPMRSNIVTLDSYTSSRSDEAAARTACDLLVRILDGEPTTTLADVVVDGAPGAESAYHGPRLRAALCGPRYALIPEVFRTVRRDPDDRVVVSLGGNPSAEVLNVTTEALRSIGRRNVHVVVGPYAGFVPASDVVVHRGLTPRDVAQLLAHARLAVVGGGQSLLQAAASAVPSVAVVLSENQSRQVRALVRHGALVASADAESLPTVLATLATDPRDLEAVGRRAAAIVDGRGCDRAAAGIIEVYRSLTAAPVAPEEGGDT